MSDNSSQRKPANEMEISVASELTCREEKKAFSEPEISSPVDVLEATTFFQATDSGVTN